MKNLLTIAGSDSSGGAGIQADLKTFSAHRTFGMSVVTAVTAQSTRGVFAVQDVDPDIIQKQIQAVFEDISVHGIKIGMVSRRETIKVIATTLQRFPYENLVVDPVMISKSGFDLLKPDAKAALIEYLLPMATMVTPNLPEAEEITGMKIDTPETMKQAAIKIHQMGPCYVLVKGGHLQGDAVDILFDGKDFTTYTGKRVVTKNTHGTGCTLSSAIAANLGRGEDIHTAVKSAKAYITTAIEHAFSIGSGPGPVHHFYELYQGNP